MGFFDKPRVKKNSSGTKYKDYKKTPQQCRSPPKPPAQPPQARHPDNPSQPSPPFQPAGLLPPPPGWNGGAQPPTLGPPQAYPPIVVNQHHYYLGPPPPYQPPYQVPPRQNLIDAALELDLESAVGLVKEVYDRTCVSRLLDRAPPRWQSCGTQLVHQGGALVDEISDRFDNVLTMIDEGGYNGQEHNIFAWQPTQTPIQAPPPVAPRSDKTPPKTSKKTQGSDHPKGQTTAAAVVISGSFFAKVDYYANSRLPLKLPPLKLYIPTYPLLCLAAQYSERVYEPPTSRAERDAHVEGHWRTGTKAMVIKSVPMDHVNTIVFAIRGTATFMDWAVNLNMAPTSPAGFLDDPGNLCHAGFLSVARNMVQPVARRLRQLLEEDPGRASYSLLITGHSAGGAVAALLYSHMLASSKAAESELNAVAGCFKRIHCITFGTPPVSLIPLAKPTGDHARRPQLRKSLFLSFVNEGDPVTRADKAYVKSLLDLFRAPTPRLESTTASKPAQGSNTGGQKPPPRRAEKSTNNNNNNKPPAKPPLNPSTPVTKGPIWRVPPCTLSCAGRIVVLRSGNPRARPGSGRKTTVEERLHEGVVAQVATDEQLRGVIWGDPVAHMMRLYAGRIEVLAVGAVTGQGY